MPRAEKDYVDFIGLLNKHKVEYLIVGAFALAVYSRPRNTGDIDIFINPAPENASSIFNAIEEFGFSDIGITVQDFLTEGSIIQLGISPVRIDILTSIDGVTFGECYERKERLRFGQTSADFISRIDLIKNKMSSNRAKDKADLDELSKFE